MIKGMENHVELIQEIRTVNALQKEEQELQEADKELVQSLKEQRDKARHKVRHSQTQDCASTSATKCKNTFSPMDRPHKKRHLRPARWVQNYTSCLTPCPRSWFVSRRSVEFMLWCY